MDLAGKNDLPLEDLAPEASASEIRESQGIDASLADAVVVTSAAGPDTAVLLTSTSDLEPATAVLLGSLKLSPDPNAVATEQYQSEISTSVRVGEKLYILSSGGGSSLQISEATDPTAPVLRQRFDLGAFTSQSVASHGNLVAVALAPEDYSSSGAKGVVRFFRLDDAGELGLIRDVEVGYLPDSIAFSKVKGDRVTLVVANEGEPIDGYDLDPSRDPVGSIGLITVTSPAAETIQFDYKDLDFADVVLPAGIRLSGPESFDEAATLEPEYVTIHRGHAYVTLQENNGIAKVDLASQQIEAVFAAGSVDYSRQLVDLSDQDGAVPVDGTLPTAIVAPKQGQLYEGLRMPDGIDGFRVKGKDYLVIANEGDAREYGDYLDEARGEGSDRVKRLSDDTTVGSSERITTFGGRSITTLDAQSGEVLWDSSNILQTIAVAAGLYDDTRSDDKGVEPEAVVVAKLQGRPYAIVALERSKSSMLAVFDLSDPTAGRFVTSVVLDASLSPEGLHVIPAKQSPTGRPQLVVSHEISNSVDLLDLEALIQAPAAAEAGSFTTAMLRDVAGGADLSITPLISGGELTHALRAGESPYVPTGIFDGMGAYKSGKDRYTLLVNSELDSLVGYGYTLPGVAGALTGARVSSLVIDRDRDNNPENGHQSAVISGGLAYDSIYLDGSNTAITSAAELGAAGFKRFCSANLIPAKSFERNRGFKDHVYLVGEEEFSGDGGSFFALNPKGRAIHELVGFGKGTWESATLIDTGKRNSVAVLLFDDAKAPLYLWLGSKSKEEGASFLERNGLAADQGSLYTFVTDALPENNVSPGPDSSDLLDFSRLNGLHQAIEGKWVNLEALDPNYASLGAPALRTLAVDAGALQLSRIEDGDSNPANGQQAIFVSTGTRDFANGDLYGNTYSLDFAETFRQGALYEGGTSVLKVINDADLLADPRTGIRSPDNLAVSADGHVYIQEDRANGGGTDVSLGQFGTEEASIWKLPLDPITGNASGDPERWLQMDRSAVPAAYGQTDPLPSDVGNWESSGIIDVSHIYDSAPGTYFLANVQAHSLKDGNIWGANYLAESGQIVLIQDQALL